MKFLTSSSKIKPLKQQLNKNKGSLQYHLFIKYKDKKFTSYLGDAYATNIVKKGDRIQYSQNDIESLLNNHDTVASFLLPYKPNTPKTNINLPKLNKNEIQLISSEYITSQTIHSKIRVGNKTYSLGRGLNLLIFNNKNEEPSVEKFDVYASKDAFERFLQRIEFLNKQGLFWAVVSHDAVKKHNDLIDKASQLGFKELPNLNWRRAYVAYKTSDGIKEIISPKSISIIINKPK